MTSSSSERFVELRRAGLANSPEDCAEQLALIADAMMIVAQDMSWVAQYADDVEPEMQAELSAHAAELNRTARLITNWRSGLN